MMHHFWNSISTTNHCLACPCGNLSYKKEKHNISHGNCYLLTEEELKMIMFKIVVIYNIKPAEYDEFFFDKEDEDFKDEIRIFLADKKKAVT